MYITWHTIITAGSVLAAVLAIFGVVLKVHKWYLQQLGANHSVPVAKDKLDKYLNNQAHK